MAKGEIIVDVTGPIPEWGLSEAVSAAVPSAGAGVEIRSTRSISDAMHSRIEASIDKDTIKRVRSLVENSKKGKHSKAVFRTGNRTRTNVLFAKEMK